ncbi:MAG: hypothetical protein IID45_04670 [Planctomycetes bacterium]|nr:hypothetical protein [Planctomycetota bacterium]
MRWGSAVSDSASLTEAIKQASEIVLEQLDGRAADLVMTFVSYQHAPSFYSVNELLQQYFGDAVIVGCSGGGVIGGGIEVERRPGVADGVLGEFLLRGEDDRRQRKFRPTQFQPARFPMLAERRHQTFEQRAAPTRIRLPGVAADQIVPGRRDLECGAEFRLQPLAQFLCRERLKR